MHCDLRCSLIIVIYLYSAVTFKFVIADKSGADTTIIGLLGNAENWMVATCTLGLF